MMHEGLCIDGGNAIQVCIHEECKISNPFICDNYKNCSCRAHCHPKYLKSIKIQQFVDYMELLKNCDYIQGIKNLESFFHQQSLVFTKFLQTHKTEVYGQIKKYYNLKYNIFQTINFQQIESGYYQALSGSQILKIQQQIERKQSHLTSSTIKNIFTEINRYQSCFLKSQSKFQDQIKNIKRVIGSKVSLNELKNIVPEIQFRFEKEDFKRDYEHLSNVMRNKQISRLTVDTVLTKLIGVTDIVMDNIVSIDSFKLFPKFSCQTLKVLSLANNNMTDASFGYVIKSDLPNLEEFKAFNNNLTDIRILLKSNWEKIGYLNFYKNKLKSDGVIDVIRKYSKQLWRIDFDANELDDKFADAVEIADWNILTEIRINKNKISEARQIRLHQVKFSNPNITKKILNKV